MRAVIRITGLATAAVIIAGCGSTPGASAPAVNTSSPAYQAGLGYGTNGDAEINAHSGTDYTKACQASYNLNMGGALVDKPEKQPNYNDFMAGCLYSLNHQSAQWTQYRTPTTNAP
jgi:hypothetical protein